MTDPAAHDARPIVLPAPNDEPLLRDLIGDALRRARTAQGKTLREVAELSQVSIPYLSEIERGRKEPSSEVLAAVNRALGMSLDELLGAVAVGLGSTASLAVVQATKPHNGAAPQAMLLAA